jgi:membrane-bound metal-dependent hydrolase YbcI (DUF457 family)
MDTITHGLTGALIGKAFFDAPRTAPTSRGRGTGQSPAFARADEQSRLEASATKIAQVARIGIWAATLGAIAPDGDSLFELFGHDELAILDVHRGLTHSFVFLPVFALILAAATRWLAKRRNWAAPSLGRLWLIYAVGLACHIVLDLITSFGTMIWSPLSRMRAAWDTTFIIDFTFTAIVLVPQVAAWVYRERAGSFTRRLLAWTLFCLAEVGAERLARAVGVPFSPWVVVIVALVLAALFFLPARRDWGFRISRAAWCRAGLAVLVVYIGLSFAAHRLALTRVEEFAASHSLNVESLGALPLPPSALRWSGLIRTPTGVYQAWFSLVDREPPAFRFFADSPANSFIAEARALPSVQRYLWFARFPLVTYRQEDGHNVVDFTDLRFFARRGQQRLGFTFRVTMDGQGRVLKEGWVED